MLHGHEMVLSFAGLVAKVTASSVVLVSLGQETSGPLTQVQSQSFYWMWQISLPRTDKDAEQKKGTEPVPTLTLRGPSHLLLSHSFILVGQEMKVLF